MGADFSADRVFTGRLKRMWRLKQDAQAKNASAAILLRYRRNKDVVIWVI